MMQSNADASKLKILYESLDQLKESGKDVVAEISKEINNIELQYLKEDVLPELMKFLSRKISWLRCSVDMNLQFDGEKQLDYSFCKSGSTVFIRDKYECNRQNEDVLEESGTDSNNLEIITSTSNQTDAHDTPKRSKTYTLRVEFPNGKVFQGNVVSDTYVAVIKEINPEKYIRLVCHMPELMSSPKHLTLNMQNIKSL